MMKQPLFGLRVLNTRPLEQGLSLHQAIQKAGGISIVLPAITIEPTSSDWLKNLPHPLDTVNHAIFISANAVAHFYSTLEQQQLAWPTTIETIAIGNATAEALTKWGIHVQHIPPIANSEHLLQLNVFQQIKNKIILLIKGIGGREQIQHTLQARNAQIIALDVYQRVLPIIPQKDIDSLWHDNKVDIILFTSQQAVHNIFSLFGDAARSWLCNKPCIVISERIAKAAFIAGMRTIIVSPYDKILNALEHYNNP